MRNRVFATFLCVVLLAVPAWAQEKKKKRGGIVTIQVDKETPLVEFIDRMSQATGTALLYNPNGQRIRNQKLGAAFKRELPESKLFDAFRAVLAFYELTLVPVGPTGYEIYLVIDSRSTNNFVKNKATYVPHEKLSDWADKDGVYISTTIPLKAIRCR